MSTYRAPIVSCPSCYCPQCAGSVCECCGVYVPPLTAQERRDAEHMRMSVLAAARSAARAGDHDEAARLFSVYGISYDRPTRNPVYN